MLNYIPFSFRPTQINIPKKVFDSRHIDLLKNKKMQIMSIEETKNDDSLSDIKQTNKSQNDSGFLSKA